MKTRLFVLLLSIFVFGCEEYGTKEAISSSGVKATKVQITTNVKGITVEQENVKQRLLLDNKPGSIKHLYVISAYSGQVIVYSTVKGKVTSSGKRLTPYHIAAIDGQYVSRAHQGAEVNIGGTNFVTGEVIQDDGTYGHSVPYVYWWDTKGVYHQHYVSGGQILHVSSEPLKVKGIIINMELMHGMRQP